MNFDDETLLSDYLDGRLDPARRLMVESSLLSSPMLSARLRELSRLREALSALPRPAIPIDLQPVVVNRVERERRSKLASAARRRAILRRVLAIAPVSTAAAALLIVWASGGIETATHAPGHPPVETALHPSSRIDERVPGPEMNASVAEFVGPPAPVIVVANSSNPPAPGEGDASRSWLHDLLESGDVGRLQVRLDPQVNPDGVEVVRSVIDNFQRADTRRALFRSGDLAALDPEHPTASVFAIVLDETEYDHFRKALKEALGPVELSSDEPDRKVIARLAEAAEVEFRESPKQAAGRLIEPVAGGGPVTAIRSSPEPSAHEQSVTLRPQESGAVRTHSRRSPGQAGERAAAGPGFVAPFSDGALAPRVYLIWLETRPGGGETPE